MGIKKMPPSGNAVGALELCFSRAGDGVFPRRFSAASRFSAQDILFTGSATGAMYLALLGMKRIHADKPQVVMPAWCCPSVAQAVLQAGLQPVFADLDPETFAYTDGLRASINDKTLAVLLVHFFGIRVPVPQLPLSPPFFLRDCAQDFMFRRGREEDADLPAFYSFGRGKSLNGGHGGALCLPAGSPLLSACRELLDGFPSAGNPLLKALILNGLSHPMAFGLLTRLPFLSIGETRWEDPLRFTRMHPGFLRLAAALLDALERNLHAYAGLVSEYARLPALSRGAARAPGPGYDRGNVPVRYPLLIADPSLRQRFMAGLNKSFGGVTGQYPDLLTRLSGAPAGLAPGGPHPGCERIAREIITLPVTAWIRNERAAFLSRAQNLLVGGHV